MGGATVVSAAVIAVVALTAPAGGHASRPAAPLLLDAGPRAGPSDRPGGGFLRVTFSPDGDGRNDRVTLHARASRGDRLVLDVHPESSANEDFAGSEAKAGAGATTLEWDGLFPDGKPRPDGSYVLEVCDTTSGRCAGTSVLAHLRLLSVYTPELTAVSPGETIPVVIATDRVGPYKVDLAPASEPTAPGFGAASISEPGTSDYRIPRVKGGLWILRATSGAVVTHYPLVVQSPLPLSDPPRGTALVVYPYITWRAYDRSDLNRDGRIDSWYAHPRDPVVPLRGPFENFRREESRAGREASPEDQQAFALWLREHPVRAQFVTDIELGRMPLAELRRYSLIAFPGHTEYYEQDTYERLLTYRDGGGRLYFLSANPFYGQVSIGASTITRLSYRYRTVTQSDFRLAATGFITCCWPRSISPRYRVSARAFTELPWLFRGTGVRPGDAFGIPLGEVDTVDRRLSPPGTIVAASATVPPFTSIHPVAPLGWIGTHSFHYERPSNHVARLDIAYASTGRGEVFSWGDTGFMASLQDRALPRAERVALDRASLNVWRRFAR